MAVTVTHCGGRKDTDVRYPPICTADGRPARSDSAMQIRLFRVSCIGPLGGSRPSARGPLWGGNHRGLWKMVPLHKVITSIITGIERRADLIVIPRPLTLTAKAPGLFRPIVERLGFRGQTIPRAIGLASATGWHNPAAHHRHHTSQARLRSAPHTPGSPSRLRSGTGEALPGPATCARRPKRASSKVWASARPGTGGRARDPPLGAVLGYLFWRSRFVVARRWKCGPGSPQASRFVAGRPCPPLERAVVRLIRGMLGSGPAMVPGQAVVCHAAIAGWPRGSSPL